MNLHTVIDRCFNNRAYEKSASDKNYLAKWVLMDSSPRWFRGTLKDYPILTRDEIKSHRNELILTEQITKKTMHETSRGTNSEPLSFLLDKDHRERGTMQKFVFDQWAGLEIGDSLLKFWGVFPSKTWRGRIKTGSLIGRGMSVL